MISTTLVDLGWKRKWAEDLAAEFCVQHASAARGIIAPFTGSTLYELRESEVDDVDMAVARARVAQERWEQQSVSERIALLLRFHDVLLAQRDEVLDLIQFETGKARRDALEEVLDVCVVIQHYARTARQLLRDRRHRGAVPGLTAVREVRHAVGVVGVIAPWNYPLSLAVSDAVAALLAGNAVIVKPDVQTSLTAAWARRLLRQVGLDGNLYQVVTGDGSTTGATLIDRVDYVMFTGSTHIGRVVAARCGERLIGCTMELGGKNAMVVRADAHIERSARIATQSIVANAGQLCISMERIYVAESIFDPFVSAVVRRLEQLVIGDQPGWGGDLGPLVTAAHYQRVTAQVDQARDAGARVCSGGHGRPDRGPFAYAPTLLADVNDQMTVCDAETFGPVASVYAVGGDDEAIERANDTEYGLNASILTSDAKTGRALARRLNTGSVNINDGYAAAWGSVASPLGGRGASGIGVRHGAAGLLAYTEPQTIATQRLWGFSVPAHVSDRMWGHLLARSTQIMRPWRPRPRRQR